MFQEQIIFGFGDIFNTTYRMNVAITRAKELLVVIGNAKILQQDPFWRSFLQFTLRNKLCVSSLSLIPPHSRFASVIPARHWISNSMGIIFRGWSQYYVFPEFTLSVDPCLDLSLW
jgi:hypothetical protein